MQEEEERFRPGTNKAVSLQVLKDAGVEGMSLGDIMDVSQSRGLKDWEPGAKRILQFVSPPLRKLSINSSCLFINIFFYGSQHQETTAA